MRYDLRIIASWIEAGSRVIDLGCGEGNLLKYLIAHKQVVGTLITNLGLEIEVKEVAVQGILCQRPTDQTQAK